MTQKGYSADCIDHWVLVIDRIMNMKNSILYGFIWFLNVIIDGYLVNTMTSGRRQFGVLID